VQALSPRVGAALSWCRPGTASRGERIVHRVLLPWALALVLGVALATSARAQSALEQEFANADVETVAALKSVRTICAEQIKLFWSYRAGQRCKGAVDAWVAKTPELTRFVADIGQNSFLASQESDACQKRLQGGQDADKEKKYALDDCPNEKEQLEYLEAKLDDLGALLKTRP
jgi:hypothetical protein